MAQHTARNCPKCKQGTLTTRVRRGFFVKYIFFWVPFKRYKCYNCGRRTYVIQRKHRERATSGE